MHAKAELHFIQGFFGGVVEDFEAYNCQQSGINSRSRFVDIINPKIINNGNVSGSAAGIFYFGWGTDCTITDAYVEGYTHGVRVIRDGDFEVGPINRNMSIDNLTVARCKRAIMLTKSDTTPATNLPCNITIKNLKLNNIVDYGVYIDDYWNHISVDGVVVDTMTGLGRVIFSDANAVGLNIKNVQTRNLPSGGYVVYHSTAISDTTTFPSATYKTPRLRIDWPSIETDGTGTKAILTVSWFYRPNTDITLDLNDALNPIFMLSTSAKTITVPADSDVDFPPGTEIVVYQEAAGQVTFAPGVGVTIHSVNGLKTSGTGARVSLFKRQSNTWWLSGSTTV